MEAYRSNALIHALFVRQVGAGAGRGAGQARRQRVLTRCAAARPQEHDECVKLIDAVLKDTGGACEYAIHVKALIERHRGERPAGDRGWGVA